MTPEQELIRDQQKQSWDKFSGGWDKWDKNTMLFMQPMADEMLRQLHPSGRISVLDIAAGTGEPGLTIAQLIPEGKVVITDLSEKMLAVAEKKRKHRDIRNVETVACDVSALPFDDETFDAVTCRCGFMFFPDMPQAVKEMKRVLKPGGKLLATVWDVPEKNPWVTTMMGTISRNMNLPPNPSGAPGMFRCSAPGMLANLFREAGLNVVDDRQVPGRFLVDSPDMYWSFMTEVGAPVVAALSQADEPTKAKIRSEVFGLVEKNYGTKDISIESSAIVVTAKK